MDGALHLGIVDEMICPYCDNSIESAGNIGNLKYFVCYLKCTEWVEDETGNIVNYNISWKDKKEKYRVHGDSLHSKTVLYKHLNDSIFSYSQPIMTLEYFIHIKDQWDLDGIIPKLLNLKVFS